MICCRRSRHGTFPRSGKAKTQEISANDWTYKKKGLHTIGTVSQSGPQSMKCFSIAHQSILIISTLNLTLQLRNEGCFQRK